MKLAALMVVAVESVLADGRTIDVCMSGATELQVTSPASSLASQVFEAVGIQVTWHTDSSCPPNALKISLVDKAPRTVPDHALASALPYEGTHIVVFYERIKAQCPYASQLLAYVLVHEITHILQGVARHSATGIMKAHWNYADYYDMRIKKMAFTEEDVRLLHLGVDLRASKPDRVLTASR